MTAGHSFLFPSLQERADQPFPKQDDQHNSASDQYESELAEESEDALPIAPEKITDAREHRHLCGFPCQPVPEKLPVIRFREARQEIDRESREHLETAEENDDG